jgi:GH24 family phage-related lysozyme (muramidase)
MITSPSPFGISFTTKEEGGSIEHVYQNRLPNGALDAPTAGVGHVLQPGDVVPCQPPFFPYGSAEWNAHASQCPAIPQAQRDAWLVSNMGRCIASVVALSRQCKIIFTQNIFDMLCDLSFNAGTATDIPADSHVALALIAGDTIGAARHMLDWDKAGGDVNAELLGRRWREVAVFLSPDSGPIMSLAAASRLIGMPLPA